MVAESSEAKVPVEVTSVVPALTAASRVLYADSTESAVTRVPVNLLMAASKAVRSVEIVAMSVSIVAAVRFLMGLASARLKRPRLVILEKCMVNDFEGERLVE